MVKWDVTIHKLFSKDPDDEKENVTQNIYVFRFIIFCIAVYSVEMLLNCAGIFIVDKTIFARGYFTGCFLAVLYIVILLLLGLEHPLTKYVSITSISLIIMAASISLTYHMVVIIVVPIIIAGMYTSKRLSIYTFVLTVFSIIVSTYAGYYYGVCDANMVLLTTSSLDNSSQNGIFLLNQVNDDPGMTIALYYVLPRCLMAISFVFVSNIVNKVIRKSLKNAMKMEQKAATDEMTGLYNKNKLLSIIEKRTYDYQQIAVIYWDINRLKHVNDTYGHFAGDQMIVKTAQSIRIALGDTGMAFRYGGDEMLALIPGGTGETAEKMIKIWKQTLAAVQVDCEIPITAAVGYSIGEHEKLKNVIAAADRNMYVCKAADKKVSEK